MGRRFPTAPTDSLPFVGALLDLAGSYRDRDPVCNFGMITQDFQKLLQGFLGFIVRFVHPLSDYNYKLFSLICQPFILTFSDIFEKIYLTNSPFWFKIGAR